MEILYSTFIGMISSKIVGMIVGIVLQCRRDSGGDGAPRRHLAPAAFAQPAKRIAAKERAAAAAAAA